MGPFLYLEELQTVSVHSTNQKVIVALQDPPPCVQV